jgi:putative hydrolase
MARSFAHQVASGANTEPNVDPTERIRLEELARVAEMHVAEATGLTITPDGSSVEILAVGPGTWAWHTVEDWQFLLLAMTGEAPAGSGTGGDTRKGNHPSEGGDFLGFGSDESGVGEPRAGEDRPGEDRGGGSEPGPFGEGELSEGGFGDLGFEAGGFGTGGEEDLLGKVMATMGPMLSAMQIGSAVGHLARTTMGTYELPIPRPGPPRLLLIPSNIARFADDWGLALDEVRLWVCLRELTIQAVLVRPHVANRIQSLIKEFLAGAPQDASGLAGLLGGIDPSDPDSIRGLFDDPTALLEIEQSPERTRVARDLAAVTAALAGYVEYVLDEVGNRLLGDRTVLSEAWRRNLVESWSSMSGTEAFLGLDVGTAQVDRGTSFVKGVIERSGTEGLARLWESEATLPTPSEVDAPGLWLERLKLQQEEPDA